MHWWFPVLNKKAWITLHYLHNLHKLSLSVKIKEDSCNTVKTILTVTSMITYYFVKIKEDSRNTVKTIFIVTSMITYYVLDIILIQSALPISMVTIGHDTGCLFFLDEEIQRGEKNCQSLRSKWRSRNSGQVCPTPNPCSFYS